MDITKYLTNKDVQLSNDDINIEKLEKDIRKGYVLSEELDKVREEVKKESTASYTELEDKYNKLEKSYNDIEARNTELTNNEKGLKQQVEMVSLGFKKENFDEVSKIRNSIYADEEDDSKAFASIKERYGATFGFNKPVEEKKTEVPNDLSFNSTNRPSTKIDVTRKTNIKDIIRR